MKKFIIRFFGICFATAFVFTLVNVNFKSIFAIMDNTPITLSNIEEINNEKLLGDFASVSLTEDIWTTGGENEKKTSLIVKLFGFIPIKKTTVVVCEDENVFLGGSLLGFSINTNGVLIVGVNSVNNKTISALESGDILTSVNNTKILNADDVKDALNQSDEKQVEITYTRDKKEYTKTVDKIFDETSSEYKLGIWVRNHAQGVGTLTFVTDDNKFGALGHSITDFETGTDIPALSGKVYETTTLGITKGSKGRAGELRSIFVEGSESKGEIEKNTHCGVFGEITNTDEVVDKNLFAPVASRMLVKAGDAKIVSSVSGVREEYDIEIIKVNNQNTSSDKSFVFRVKDKRLISLTGGIVQGMSGSPIIQDGKLIGAVTHVFLYDSTKGYGVYSDWMLEQVA